MVRAAKARVPTLALAVGVSMVAIWAGYRFSFGSVTPGGIPVPAPEFFRGIQAVQSHLDSGHDGYLLGETRRTGFWNFYLVAIAFKTPLGFLALLAIGVVLAFGKYPLARRLWCWFWYGRCGRMEARGGLRGLSPRSRRPELRQQTHRGKCDLSLCRRC